MCARTREEKTRQDKKSCNACAALKITILKYLIYFFRLTRPKHYPSHDFKAHHQLPDELNSNGGHPSYHPHNGQFTFGQTKDLNNMSKMEFSPPVNSIIHVLEIQLNGRLGLARYGKHTFYILLLIK